MKKIESKASILENLSLLGELINSHLSKLNVDTSNNAKKKLELCHAGKLLMLLNADLQIETASEQPDFILQTSDGRRVGLEHQIVVNKEKEKEGFVKNLFDHAEKEISAEPDLPNFLASCDVNSNVSYKTIQKREIIDQIKNVVREAILNGYLIPNNFITRISITPHTLKSIVPNLGAWWQKNVTSEIIIEAISKKEKKLAEYRFKSVTEQWLLLVIGSLDGSSYEMDSKFDLNVTTQFDRIYILEDFRNNLYELK